jgi:hypothetical protein
MNTNISLQASFRIKHDKPINASFQRDIKERGSEQQTPSRVDLSLLDSGIRKRFPKAEIGVREFIHTPKHTDANLDREHQGGRKSEKTLDISKLVGHFHYNEKATTLRQGKPSTKPPISRISSIRPRDQHASKNVSYYDNKIKENMPAQRLNKSFANVSNKQSSMIRSKIDLFEMEKRLNSNSTSKNTKVTKIKRVSIGSLPQTVKSSVKFRIDERKPDQSKHRPLGQSSTFAYRNQVASPDDMGIDTVIHIRGRPSEKIRTRFSTKGNTEFQLQHFILRDQLRQPERVDNINIDSFYDKETLESSAIIIPKIESQISKALEANLESVKNYGSRICRRAKESISKIIEPNNTAKQNYRYDLLQKMKDFLLFYKTLKLAPESILRFPIRPYTDPKSSEFVESAKFGDTERIKELLYKFSDLLIYEFDYLHLTALHWASKRNHAHCAAELILRKSYVNARDVYGRTPLYYAIQNKCASLVYMLMVYHASPWSPRNANYIELADGDQIVIYYIKKFRFLDLILTFQKREDRPEVRRQFIEKKIRVPKSNHLDGKYPNQ